VIDYRFTATVVLAAALALIFPQWFVSIGTFEMKSLIVPLLQIIMFGMGTTLGLADFVQVAKAPRSVALGLLCQFGIMPLVGFSLASVFGFPPEIAAGVILIGCVPSGLASNVMSYIAKANVALSITITAVATLLAPFVTPQLMKLLVGTLIVIDVFKMTLDILYIVILPIGLGLLINRVFRRQSSSIQRYMPRLSMAGIVVIIAIITAIGRDNLLAVGMALAACVLIHNLCGYLFGYVAARLLRMPEQDCRTVSLEVGLQNGGLASGIALMLGKVGTVGLAPALFGPIMNVTGSLLAGRWARSMRSGVLVEKEGAHRD
jgi:BASS family bile acid:Na+ symporter